MPGALQAIAAFALVAAAPALADGPSDRGADVANDRTSIEEPAKPEPLPKRAAGAEDVEFATVELVAFQVLHGMVLGVEFCGFSGCGEGTFLGVLFGGVLGGVIAAGVAPKEMSGGQAMSVNAGTGWGLWHGFALAEAADFNRVDESMGLALLGQILGTALGAAAGAAFTPGRGGVAIANSGGIWAGVLMLLIQGASDFKLIDDKDLRLAALLAATDLGLMAGGFLARDFPMTRGRSALIDVAGLVGMLAGFLAGGQITDGDEGIFLAGIPGLLAGLATGVAATQGWDAPDLNARLTLSPNRKAPGLALTWDF